MMAQQGTAGDTHHYASPLAFGAGVSSRSWEGSISTATGTKKIAPRITKPSGRTAAGCSLLSRWATGTGTKDKLQNLNLYMSNTQRLPSAGQES